MPPNTDLIRAFTPLDFRSNLTSAAVTVHYEQLSVMTPAFHVVSAVLSTLAGVNETYDPLVIRNYMVANNPQNTVAHFFEVAQRLQVSTGRQLSTSCRKRGAGTPCTQLPVPAPISGVTRLAFRSLRA